MPRTYSLLPVASPLTLLPSLLGLSMQTVTGCLYGASTTPRLRQQGMELAVWVFRNAEPAQLAPAAAAILEGCLSLLDHGRGS